MLSRSGTWAAPGRMNLIGEHTDYNDGLALPIALEQTTRATVSVRADGILRLTSKQSTEVFEGALHELAPEAVGGWASYAAGVLWVLRTEGYHVPGLDIGIDSDVPIGAGLSSSAALACSIALAANDVAGLGLDRRTLARICQRAENEFAGVPTGAMDQTASLLCTRDHALLIDFHDGGLEQIPFDPAGDGLALLVIDTGADRALADGQYAVRREQCARVCAALGIDSLREATPADLDRVTDRRLVRRARHVLTENQRVLDAVGLLRIGRAGELGPLLTASHKSLRDDYEVSAPELDAAVEAALDAGALGARMTGGGFGGSAIALLDEGRAVAVRAAVAASFAELGFGVPRIFAVRPGPGARQLNGA